MVKESEPDYPHPSGYPEYEQDPEYYDYSQSGYYNSYYGAYRYSYSYYNYVDASGEYQEGYSTEWQWATEYMEECGTIDSPYCEEGDYQCLNNYYWLCSEGDTECYHREYVCDDGTSSCWFNGGYGYYNYGGGGTDPGYYGYGEVYPEPVPPEWYGYNDYYYYGGYYDYYYGEYTYVYYSDGYPEPAPDGQYPVIEAFEKAFMALI